MTLPDGDKPDDDILAAAPQEGTPSDGTPRDGRLGDETLGDAAQKSEPPTGTALSETSGAAGIDPFLARLSAAGSKPPGGTAEAPVPRSVKGMMLDYSAHAAMIVGLIGFAWTVSDHVVARPTAAQIEAPAPKPGRQAEADAQADTVKQADLSRRAEVVMPADAAKPVAAVKSDAATRDDIGDLRAANRQLAGEVGALRAEIGALHAALDHAPDEVRSLTAELERAKADLQASKSEAGSAIAQLSGKIDRLQHDPNSKMQQLVDKLADLEHKSVDASPTGSIAPSQAAGGSAQPLPLPPAKTALAKTAPAKVAGAPDDGRKTATDKPADEIQQKPQVLTGWVVRDVYEGVALVEGRRGQIEVVPGVSIPGAGVVKSIDRHGNGWTVTTTRGLLASAAPQQRDHRRGNPRDGYPVYPYDF